jgi:predicted O-methyltransferase YrrM
MRQVATASAPGHQQASNAMRERNKAATVAKPQTRPLLVALAQKLHNNDLMLRVMRETFRQFQRIGITVSPNHYYWPVPDFDSLEKRSWPKAEAPIGFDLGIPQQLDFVQSVVPMYRSDWEDPDGPFYRAAYNRNNGFFETIDAEIAYCLVRHLKPRRIIEVGAGYSSRVLAAALARNLQQDGVCGEMVTIDPYPDRYPQQALSDQIQLITEPIQSVDLDIFLTLRSGDFLFLDSSHVVGVGSDVVREYLEILPRLEPGVVIHAHDIFIPSDYPKDAVLNNLAFWSEQYLLQALLMFNPHFEVLWGSSAMQTFESAALEEAFPHWATSYRDMPQEKRRFLPTVDGGRVWPSSFWIRRIS